MLVGSDHREIRKVQFTGKSTYVLSLPKRWIEEMHLKAGDQVALIRELDNSLSILPFISGLRESVNEVTAIILPMPELSISTAIRRMYLIASSMHRDAMLALTELNYELAKEVIKSDDEVDRFSLYIFRNLVMAMQNGRVLREMGLENPSNCLSYRVAAKSIERVADHACGIADKATKLKDKIPEKSLQKIQKMSHFALTVLENSVEALLRRDYQLADMTVDTAENIRMLEDEVLATLEKDIGHDQSNIKLALESIRRTAEYASDIAEAAINETIGEVTEKHSASRRR
ncbi:MAG: phosphate uptake regulator PhoU [Thermoproteota archaeon]|nr:phosphate uptake regulator PhoU [Thermoproteota archaeon]